MTDEELDEIKKACAEATAGPWRAELGGYAASHPECAEDFSVLLGHDEVLVLEGDGGSIGKMKDGAFIAGARSWVPALVAEVRRLRAFKEQATKQFILEWPKGPPEMVQFPDGHIEFKIEPMRVRQMTLDDARALSRREALEEAAKVAEEAATHFGHANDEGEREREVAAAIRALGAK